MLENCRWLLYVSRLYGCHPHTIDKRSTLTNFYLLLLYSLFICSIHCIMAYYSIAVNHCIAKNAMIVGCILQHINRYSQSSYIILSILLSCLWHIEFERAVAAAYKFDDLIRHYYRINNVQINYYTQCLIVVMIIINWTLFGALEKFVISQTALYIIVIQCATRAMFSMEIAKFYFLYDTLRYRFCHLSRLYREMTGNVSLIIE